MLESAPDIVVGIVFFAALMAGAVVLGGVLQRSSRARNRAALADLAVLLDAKPNSDHQSGWIVGRYRDRPVEVRMVPRKNIGESSDSATTINAFEVLLPGTEGHRDWAIARTGLLRKSWDASSPDETLRRRLAEAGLIEQVRAFGDRSALEFNAGRRTLRFRMDAGRRLAPKPEEFRALLELMFAALGVNREPNRDPG